MAMEETVEGYQLSLQQKHLWLQQQKLNTLPFRTQCVVQITGILELTALQTALHNVTARYEIFRTTFCFLPGMDIPLQVIHEELPPDFEVLQYQGSKVEDQNGQVESLFDEIDKQTFDLEQGPLFRAALVTLSAEQHLLLLTLPALCADKGTLQNLVQELSYLYAAASVEAEEREERLE
jgi:hypothetical protein